ncbi:MAG: GAF domain-containing protein, partial [Mycobacteriales bacterium]
TGAWATRRHLRRATEERASIVVHILDEALGILDGAGVADSVVARTAAALRADVGTIDVATPEGLQVLGVTGYPPSLRSRRLQPGEGLSGQAWEGGEPIVCADVRREPAYLAGHPRVRSGLYVPARLDGVVVGVLAMESFRARAFDSSDLALAQPVADLVAALLAHGRAVQEALGGEEDLVAVAGRELSAALAGLSEPDLLAQAHAAETVVQVVDAILLAAREDGEIRPVPVPLDRPLRTVLARHGRTAELWLDTPPGTAVLVDEAAFVEALERLMPAGEGDVGPIVAAPSDVPRQILLTLPWTRPAGLGTHVARRLLVEMGVTLTVSRARMELALPAQAGQPAGAVR